MKTEEPVILAAVKARHEKLAHIDDIAERLLDHANMDGLELVALLIEARLLLGGLRDRPGITMRQIHEFLERADRVLGL